MDYRKIERVIEAAMHNGRFFSSREQVIELAIKAGFKEVTRQLDEESSSGEEENNATS